MNTGSIFTIFLLIFLNFNFAFSSPTINIVEIQVKENDPFCLNSAKKNTTTTTINYEYDYIPKTDEIELNEDWISYFFDGLVAMSIGAILSLILRDFLLIFFEDEIRIHGIVKGIYKASFNF
uniref:Uncharacterized protein n=1 Tax=Panagrolaimus sp. PS1159 TaxID=55785 RepID=A0AC35F181_9BILA